MRTLALLMALAPALAAQDLDADAMRVPIRNLTRLHGSMRNTLTGIGLVTGLRGTGSADEATRQATANFVRNFGLNITSKDLTSGSVALVSVSADLPAFAHTGMEIDVTVKTIGDATSLEGGVLENTPLVYFDGYKSQTYVTASGVVSTGGFGARSSTATVTRNNPTTGRITRGGRVVESLEPEYLSEAGDLELILRNPSMMTAQNITRAINRVLHNSGAHAIVRDEALVRITLPRDMQSRDGAIRTLGLVSGIPVAVENPSKIVIDPNTGLVIAGVGVHISPCVVTMSDLTISIIDEEDIIQPIPGIGFNRGTTERVDRSHIDVEITDNEPRALAGGGATVAELLANLRALDLSARQLVEVFKSLDRGHFLHAPLEVR